MTTETHTPERATPETERVKNLSLGCTLMRALKDMTDHAEGLERQRDELLEALEKQSNRTKAWRAIAIPLAEVHNRTGHSSSCICVACVNSKEAMSKFICLIDLEDEEEAAIAKATSPNTNQAR